MFRLKTPIGIVALATLLWSGIGFFSALSHHISQAWPDARMRNFLGMRVMGLKMAGVLLLLLLVSVIVSLAADLLPHFPVIVPELRALVESRRWGLLSNLVPLVAGFVLFLALYKWVPNTEVTWRAAFFGALLAAIAWQLVTAGFSWYLGSGLSTYEVVLWFAWWGRGDTLLGLPEQRDRGFRRAHRGCSRHDTCRRSLPPVR